MGRLGDKEKGSQGDRETEGLRDRETEGLRDWGARDWVSRRMRDWNSISELLREGLKRKARSREERAARTCSGKPDRFFAGHALKKLKTFRSNLNFRISYWCSDVLCNFVVANLSWFNNRFPPKNSGINGSNPFYSCPAEKLQTLVRVPDVL